MAPKSCHWSMPELMVIDRDPGLHGRLDAALEAVGVGHRHDQAVGARRRRRCRSASPACRRPGRSCTSGRPRSPSPACSAPAFTTSQNESPGAPWVTTRCGCRRLPPPLPPPSPLSPLLLSSLLPLSPRVTACCTGEHEQPGGHTSGECPSDLHGVPPCCRVIADCADGVHRTLLRPHRAVGKLKCACWSPACSTCGHRAVTTLARV